MTHLTMPIPVFSIGHLVTPRAYYIHGNKKQLMAHLTIPIPLFHWPFGHAKSK
jgi:hypothetical protein